MNNKVNWAVIPCAGKGTRFLPITKGLPKEMLPIVDRPTLDYIVQELVDSGIENIVFIVSKDKDEIKKYYDIDKAYEDELINSDKEAYAKMIHVFSEDYKNGWYEKVEAMQGKKNTYYAGEVMSFGDMEETCEYSRELVERFF